jgi:hypothetical protein
MKLYKAVSLPIVLQNLVSHVTGRTSVDGAEENAGM